jgi:hypothetical protein
MIIGAEYHDTTIGRLPLSRSIYSTLELVYKAKSEIVLDQGWEFGKLTMYEIQSRLVVLIWCSEKVL